MAGQGKRLLERLIHRQTLRRWERVARAISGLGLHEVVHERARARTLRRRLDAVIRRADARLDTGAGAAEIRAPYDADWIWRPGPWQEPLAEPGIVSVRSGTRLGDDVSVFHDCTLSEICIRQQRNPQQDSDAALGVRLDVFAFSGTYLSMTLGLPDEATRGLKRRHLIRIEPVILVEHPIRIYCRLNVKHGPNTDQVVRDLPPGEAAPVIEFDLAYTGMNEKRVERMWLDLILDAPQMNRIVVRDLILSRRPRAEL